MWPHNSVIVSYWSIFLICVLFELENFLKGAEISVNNNCFMNALINLWLLLRKQFYEYYQMNGNNDVNSTNNYYHYYKNDFHWHFVSDTLKKVSVIT